MKLIQSAALAAVLGLATATSTFAQDVTLRFQHFISPKGAVPSLFMAPWAEKIMADSDGRIKVELYPAMQLGGAPPALFDQIRDNVIDGGMGDTGIHAGSVPDGGSVRIAVHWLNKRGGHVSRCF